jgi:putative transposase
MQEAVLPEWVQDALGQLVGAAKEGLLALSVGVGLGVLESLMEEEVEDVVGPKGSGTRHAPRSGTVTRTARSRSVAVAWRSAGRG